MRTAPQSHYVTHNKVTRVPRNFVYFDSEARRAPTDRGEVQTFRLAVAAHDRRRHDHDGWAEREQDHFDTPAGLWAWIDARTQARARTVAVAHNLAYDLRITNALTELPALGWSLGACRVDRGQAWMQWRRDDRTLMLCDSFAWCPVSLDKLAELVELPKLPLPEWDDSDAAWLARCVRDVEILGAVWRRLVEWVKADDLGNWKPTGAGQAWAAYRHRFMGHRLLAHDNVAARVAERRAAWTGRCEVWRHGSPVGGPFTEWDFSAAYAHVAADCEIPIKLVGDSTRASVSQWETLTKKYAVLTECTITTDTPTVPALIDGRIAWPVGTFTTTIWENELRLALENGANCELHHVWWYKRAPALAAFGRWVLERVDNRVGNLDPVVVLAAKHWGRALVGRFGARWSEWERVGHTANVGLDLSTVIDKGAGERWKMLHVGHELKRQSPEYDSPDSVVSVMSWVMAECRVRLWGALQAAGPEHVLYMDTDSVIVTEAGSERLSKAAIPNLRRKGTWSSIELLGPRQYVVGGRLVASGVPRGSVRVAPSTWEGEVWTELATSLRNREADRVRVTTRRVRVAGKDARRDHLAGGATAPRRVDVPA